MGGKQLSPLAPPALCAETLKWLCRTRPCPGCENQFGSLQNMVKYLLTAQVPHGNDPEVPRHLMIIRITQYLSSH